MRRPLLCIALSALACLHPAFGAEIGVAATFTIPADIAKSVGGESVKVRSITPPNADFHALQPTPAQIKALADAELVVAMHPEMEPWIADLEEAGTFRRPVLYLAKGILGEHLAGAAHTSREQRHFDCCAAENDPHVWMDPELTGVMARTLASRLAEIAPAEAPRLRASGEACATRMTGLVRDMRAALAVIPKARRKFVSQHGNLARLADKFELTVAGTLLDSPSTEAADPSAKRLSKIIARIRSEKVPAVFADNTLSPELPAAVAREAGLPPPATLHVDALDAPGTPAGTYEGMMRENARRIAEALK